MDDGLVLHLRHAVLMHGMIGRNIAVHGQVEVRSLHVINNMIPAPAFVRNSLY